MLTGIMLIGAAYLKGAIMNTWVEISQSKLRKNYQTFAKMAGHAALMPVIKSNAYGHGLLEVSEALAFFEPEWIGVNSLREAQRLTREGVSSKILVVGPTFKQDLPFFKDCGARFVLGHMDLLDAWLAMETPPHCHLKIDTGMSRQGFLLGELAGVIQKIKNSGKGFSLIEGVLTHFANVEDVFEHDYADLQLSEFNTAVSELKAAGFEGAVHAASSASSLLLPSSRFDIIRVGISLYGFWPSKATRLSFAQGVSKQEPEELLEEVLTWKTRVAQIKAVKKGRFVGYGCTYRAARDMKVAVLPVGYYEGYPRLASSKQSYVLVDGHRCLVVGRICMNMMMVDVSDVPGVTVGIEAVLIGSSGEEKLSAAKVAEWADTIHYELLTRINSELQRVVVP
jgi:alanine racemase